MSFLGTDGVRTAAFFAGAFLAATRRDADFFFVAALRFAGGFFRLAAGFAFFAAIGPLSVFRLS
ncbi:MAG TPA: hypothetical protein VMQ73_01280 [Methylomirabilota bacterium]|nr:hypothetical protein [Methylomirabilota bacterium]